MRWIRVKTGHSAAGIYGTLLTLSILVGLTAEGAGPGVMAGSVAVGVAIFWIAHVHAELVSTWVDSGGRPRLSAVTAAFRRERPMLDAAVPALGLLVLAWIGVIGTALAVWIALLAGVVALVAWGVSIAHAARLGPWGVIIVAGINLALGGVIVLLKLLVH